MDFYPVLLQAAQSEASPQSWITMVYLFAVFAIIYFLMIRPKQQEVKQKKQFLSEIKKGDKVTIFGGIHGKIVSLKESTAVVQIDDQTKITVEKGALQQLPSNE